MLLEFEISLILIYESHLYIYILAVEVRELFGMGVESKYHSPFFKNTIDVDVHIFFA